MCILSFFAPEGSPPNGSGSVIPRTVRGVGRGGMAGWNPMHFWRGKQRPKRKKKFKGTRFGFISKNQRCPMIRWCALWGGDAPIEKWCPFHLWIPLLLPTPAQGFAENTLLNVTLLFSSVHSVFHLGWKGNSESDNYIADMGFLEEHWGKLWGLPSCGENSSLSSHWTHCFCELQPWKMI